ncbi:MAG: glycoside hydrolase family 25 protein [Lachnospiraceae bacterium]|nr:glycoside hydrolase family 25 protein [Lachnospiraceae bacterium]
MSMLHNNKKGSSKNLKSSAKMVLGSVSAFSAVVLIVAVTVLMNQPPKRHAAAVASEPESVPVKADTVTWTFDEDAEKRTSDEMNFWHMYDSDEEPVSVVPENQSEEKQDDRVLEPEKAVSEDAADDKEETVSEDSLTPSRNSVSGNFFDQNELTDGEESIVPINMDIKKNELIADNFSNDGQYKIYSIDEEKTSSTGIDVSKYQGTIDWKKASKAGFDFAMIRMGARGYTSGRVIEDEQYAANMKGCSENNIKTGIYFFSQAVTPEEAIVEANYCIAAIEGYKVEYPIVFDSEIIKNDIYRTQNLTPKEMSAIAQAFCNTILMYGQTPMIGATKKQFASRFELADIEQYDWWLFDTDDMSVFPYKYSMWQYSKTGEIEGINGSVNLDIAFIDYSAK